MKWPTQRDIDRRCYTVDAEEIVWRS